MATLYEIQVMENVWKKFVRFLRSIDRRTYTTKMNLDLFIGFAKIDPTYLLMRVEEKCEVAFFKSLNSE